MQREIKFRAWDKTEKCFIGDNYFHYIFVGLNGWILDSKKDDGRDDIVLQQYTGLKDRNGKEIWEGDIIKVKIWFGQIYSVCNLPVVFGNGVFGYKLYEGGGTYETIILDGDEEVIGNIFENLELIENEN